MTDKQQPEALRLANALEYCDASVARQAINELRLLHAELEALRAGYAAARLDIETLKAQLAAQQPGVAYAALPEPITYQIAALKACEHGDALVGWRVEPSRQSFDASMRPKRKLYTEGDMHDFADRTHALRASHGQAPAAVAGPVVNRATVIEWLDANDIEVTDRQMDGLFHFAAPTTQPSPQREPAEIDTATMVLAESVGLIGPASRTHDLHGAIQRFHDLICANATIKAAQMAAEAISAAAPQPSPAAQGDALDTMRLDWLDADESRCVFHLGKSWYTRPSYGLPYRKRASLREAIDDARKEMS